MNKRNLLISGVWAMGMFALVLGVFLPRGLNADNAAATPTPIKVPTLSGGGCDIVAHVVNAGAKNDRGQYAIAAGQPVTIEVTATNTTADAQDISVKVTLGYYGAVSPMSRAMPAPTTVKQATETFSLAPHESKTVTVPGSNTDKTIPKDTNAWLAGSMAGSDSGNRSVMFQNLVASDTATTQPADASVSVR
jgi:hypothetical protein